MPRIARSSVSCRTSSGIAAVAEESQRHHEEAIDVLPASLLEGGYMAPLRSREQLISRDGGRGRSAMDEHGTHLSVPGSGLADEAIASARTRSKTLVGA